MFHAASIAAPFGARQFDTGFERTADALLLAAHHILPAIEAGSTVNTAMLRSAMKRAFGGSDAEGAWDWKLAYDASEAAQILFLRKYRAAMLAKAVNPQVRLALIERVAALLPTHTRRSECGQALQQFSTPPGLAFVASVAGAIRLGDRVLEPSAGTGLVAVQAELMKASLVLNELAEIRAALLTRLFPGVPVTRFDAAQIHDHLDTGIVPDLVLMNPPFSAVAHVERTMRDAALRHISSALARLRPGGRLVTITGAGFSPYTPGWRDAFSRLQERGQIVFSCAIDGRVFARHGTNVPTRLTVVDHVPAPDPDRFPPEPATAQNCAALLEEVLKHVPPRPDGGGAVRVSRSAGPVSARAPAAAPGPDICPVAYTTRDWTPPDGDMLGDAIYEPYVTQSLVLDGARAHPTPLVQSVAMASVAPPKPSYQPWLPAQLIADGILSDAQLETIIYVGEAHRGHLAGAWKVDETRDVLSAAAEDMAEAVRFRRGWFLGDGTGAGKGRQVAGVILDNWLQGRRRALWISASDRLLEDAQRDWSALGQERLLVTPLSRFRQGAAISLDQGIVFTTYATLRSQARGEKASRLDQIVEWLGTGFDGVIVFDEAHAMANAAGGRGARGEQAPSQQGRAGLHLQRALPDARIIYVSATGATTVQNLAYAERLGLWGCSDFPFATRAEFVSAIESGGVAAMEVLARDLKALGLYAARSLSFGGVEYETLEHRLTSEQVRIYDAYAGAFQVIHNNLDAAMQAANITGVTGTLNGQARSAARSAFESAKQRFFNHLIVAMQTPSLIASMTEDLEQGHSPVIQIVSTGEALMERRLAEIPTDSWNDVQVDITPREYVLDYLAHSFPVQLYEPFTDGEGNLASRPVMRDGRPVLCRDALDRRQHMLERLAALPPVPGALDQILHRFGTDEVAEVTGRMRRIVARSHADGSTRFAVEGRPGSANLAETHAFMGDRKRILIFSEAGGTGRSYHADLGCPNQRLRIHYLLEPGWKADAAIQGFGRTNRTNQKQPPRFRPVTTNVRAQKRFISTIARRLDSLGAITRGQRQTGGQNMFSPRDNLESDYARDALRQLYGLIVEGRIEGCPLAIFEAATGLRLVDSQAGGLLDELPGITTFLNRMLALTIGMQDVVFTAFEDLMTRRIEGAIASGTYETGLETLHAESFVISERRTIYAHPETGAATELLTIARRDHNQPRLLADILQRAIEQAGALLVNSRSGHAAVQVRARSMMLEDGAIEHRVRLLRPMSDLVMSLDALASSHWQAVDQQMFCAAWNGELAAIPVFETSIMHIVSGLLLPIWKRLPDESSRVYRLQTDAGERIIGRRVSPAWVTATIDADSPSLSAEDGWAIVSGGEAILHLAENQLLQRVLAMGLHRVELLGFSDLAVERLKAMGLISEIISWKLRLFIPMGAHGDAIFAKLVERFPIQRVAMRGRTI